MRNMTNIIKCSKVALTELEKLIVQSKFVGGFDKELEKEFARCSDFSLDVKKEKKDGLYYSCDSFLIKFIVSTIKGNEFDLEKNLSDEMKKIAYGDFYNNFDSQMLLKVANAASIDTKEFDKQNYDSILGKEALPLVYHGLFTGGRIPSNLLNARIGKEVTMEHFENKIQLISEKGLLTNGVTCITPCVDLHDFNFVDIGDKLVYALVVLPYNELYRDNLINREHYPESLTDFDYSLPCHQIILKKNIPPAFLEGIYYAVGDETSKSEDLQLQILTEIFRRQNPSYKLGVSLNN